MEGEWKFYRENGQLWQIGNFLKNKKNGAFLRYDKAGNLEYDETFTGGMIRKKKQ